MDWLANQMKKVVRQIKMADLHFVDFALIPSPVRKEKPIRKEAILEF